MDDLAECLAKETTNTQKILVYVPFVYIVEQLGKTLACHMYHGKMSIEDRKATQTKFSSCHAGLLVATSAFLVGIHIPNIDGVI